MLNKRLDLLHQKQIEVNIEDARNYNLMSMILDNFMPDTIVQLAASRMLINPIKIPTLLLIIH